ncbi:MAG: hypothetical protein ACTTJ3_08880, partial [Treponema sp.]
DLSEELMSWTLIYFLFVVLVFGIFSMFNIKNTCTISFFFYEFENIPVYTAAVFSFIAGSILSLPFFIKRKSKSKTSNPLMQDIQTIDLANEKKGGFFGRMFKKKDDEPFIEELK